jgi:hypothetical protein
MAKYKKCANVCAHVSDQKMLENVLLPRSKLRTVAYRTGVSVML